MLSLDDPRWAQLQGGYRVLFDPRPLLRAMEVAHDVGPIWKELWNNLHHQGDVGEASYAAVPHLVRIHKQRDLLDWNTYGLVATIDIAKDSKHNPSIPEWLQAGYVDAMKQLGETAMAELPRIDDAEIVRAILAVVALWKGARTYGRLLVDFTEDEVLELEAQAFGPRE